VVGFAYHFSIEEDIHGKFDDSLMDCFRDRDDEYPTVDAGNLVGGHRVFPGGSVWGTRYFKATFYIFPLLRRVSH